MYVKPWIKDIKRIGGDQGRAEYLRLDMNENPGGLPSAFVEEIKRELTPEYLAMYPEEHKFLQVLSRHIGEQVQETITPDHLCLTNGSDMAIRYLFEVFAQPGSSVVTVAPSFEMYRIYSQVFHLIHRPISCHEDYTIPICEILEGITEDTDIVVLLNPNNPIGHSYTEEDFQQIVGRAAKMGALVIIDEAYHYFYKKTFLKEALAQEHVVVLRTFSKLMSLAGCRMGYLVANPNLIQYVKNVRPSFEVNGVALLFGEKLLTHPTLIADLEYEARAGKSYLLEQLNHKGYETIEQDGNFIFVKPLYETAEAVAKALEKKKILVKTYGAPLLKDYLRISTGSTEFMELFLQALYEVDCL